jgi:hypothetical protein
MALHRVSQNAPDQTAATTEDTEDTETLSSEVLRVSLSSVVHEARVQAWV